MARIEYIRHRLERWARWCAQQDSGGLGYPSQTAFARLGAASGGYRESVIPINAIEAQETDQAVQALRPSQPHLHLVLVYTYAQGLPRHLVAKKMGRAESTVSQNLADADHAVDRWLQDKAATRERVMADFRAMSAAAKKSFPT